MNGFLKQHHFRFVVSLLVAASLLFGVSRFVDVAVAVQRFDDYPLPNLGFVLLLSLGYFVLKALRWHYLLSVLDIKLPLRRSLLLYMAGQWFAVAPAGEFMRAYMLTSYGFSLGRGSAAVMAQILFDFLSLAIVGSLSVYLTGPVGAPVIIFTIALIGATLAFAHGPLLTRRLVGSSITARLPLNARLADFYRYSRFLLGWRSLFIASALGIAAVAAGFLVLLEVSLGYQIPIDVGQAAYIYSLSQLAGAISMLPHGLGAIEGSSVALYHYAGVDVSNAAGAVVLFRLCTLGWGLVIGGLSLLALRTPLAGRPFVKGG